MKTKGKSWLGGALALTLCLGFASNANAQQVWRPVKSCSTAFLGFQKDLEKAMKDSWGTEVGQQAVIAYDKLGYGEVPDSNSTPQDYTAMEEMFGAQMARRALADKVERHLGYMGGPGHTDHIRKFLPKYRMNYRALNDEMIRISKIVDRQERAKARNPYINELRRTASMGAIGQALGGSMNVNAMMTEFWFNHFNVDATKVPIHAMHYERQLQARMCGTFLDLLVTSATHPAMLRYLDNFRSRRGSINENYGRELLELYTLGIGPKTSAEKNSPFTQKTVTDASRLLTGWTFTRNEGEAPKFIFREKNHDPARPKIMGKTHPAGFNGGMSLLKDLANRAFTKTNICTKLSTELFGDKPPSSIVSGCVARWGTDGDLVAIYKYLLTRPRFWSGSNLKNSVKTPIELVASGSRAMGYPINRLEDYNHLRHLYWSVQALGMTPRRVAPPTGYPVVGRAWINPNYQAEAANFGYKMADDRVPLRLDDKNFWGDGKERKIASIAKSEGNGNAVSDYLFLSLRTRPVGYWSEAGRPLLRDAFARPDKDKNSGLALPGRTINSLILNSNNFVRK